MLILVMDSSGASCGVGVAQDGAMLSQYQENMQRGQDAKLMPLVLAALAKAGKKFCDVDRVAVTRGPGSFTGVRVGLAAARGIGLAASCSVVGVDRFSIYHRLHQQPRDLLVVIDSKRDELFCKFYPSAGTPHDPVLMTEADIQNFLKDHPSADVMGDLATPQADILKASAEIALTANPEALEFLPRPLYLRAPDVTFPRAQTQLSDGFCADENV